MITLRDIEDEISKCFSDENPTYSTCTRLAAYMTIRDHMVSAEQSYNQSEPQFTERPRIIDYDGESEFSNLVYGLDIDDVWGIIDEAMDAIKAINPRLYAGVVRRIGELPKR